MAIGPKGRAFRDEVYYTVRDKYPKRVPFLNEVSVVIWYTPPDKRTRDSDNILKCLLDSLEHANIYNNDSQITKLLLYKIAVKKPGNVKVIINERSIIK